jgi:hypothetical protein
MVRAGPGQHHAPVAILGGRLLGLDAMGYWYEPENLAALAEKYGLYAEFVNSDLYPYRFHAVIHQTAPNRDGKNGPEYLNAKRRGAQVIGVM